MERSEKGRVAGKVAIITGAARGIGEAIAIDFAKEGACVVLADVNIEKAQNVAEQIDKTYGARKAIAVMTDVTDEKSVQNMVERTLQSYGGIDILVCNAGVVRAGSIERMSLDDFEFVTKVNYVGYFLCVKHVARTMTEQHRRDPSRTMDIIQINSKSGLQGSYKNAAYAGSKFGGVGLTQSFALELLEHGIKVNAICPGNYFDGPLWSDPTNGLFAQYLKEGKVPGAKSIDEVRRYYESKIPMGRGCATEDILRAIYYVIEQFYETGQCILVSGGQVMK